jgi:hypothetical protein
VHQTLREIGDFEPFNMVLLEDSSAEQFRGLQSADVDTRQTQLRAAESGRLSFGLGTRF